ncbi:MAG TPA: hypothetical protein VH878_05265 [Thermodesulfobacteriota bacterium]|jgi:hypothetical protein
MSRLEEFLLAVFSLLGGLAVIVGVFFYNLNPRKRPHAPLKMWDKLERRKSAS